MNSLWPSTLIYILTVLPVFVISQNVTHVVKFTPDNLKMNMTETNQVTVNVSNLVDYKVGDKLYIMSTDWNVVTTDVHYYLLDIADLAATYKIIKFNLTGKFIGKAKIYVVISGSIFQGVENMLDVKVIRKKSFIDHAFTGSVILLVSIIYINFGCALDWNVVKSNIRRPVGPIIGACTQFIFMPLISYFTGLILFPENSEMRLGMFFTGVSPSGGASNIWTYVLKGNLNLSITMTTLSTFLAFGMMPFWLFTLGQEIFQSAQIAVPYTKILQLAMGLVIPLGLGLLSQRYIPRFAKLMVRILKTFSIILLLFIIIFAIVTNVYIFELFSWKIIVAGMCVPWLGYLLGYLAAILLKQPLPDCLAIGIETGVQNTGISIFLLQATLDKLEADLTTVIPVSIAIMTPIPMICLYLYQIIKDKWFPAKAKVDRLNETTPGLSSSLEDTGKRDDTEQSYGTHL